MCLALFLSWRNDNEVYVNSYKQYNFHTWFFGLIQARYEKENILPYKLIYFNMIRKNNINSFFPTAQCVIWFNVSAVIDQDSNYIEIDSR